jgi:hypothetical protein
MYIWLPPSWLSFLWMGPCSILKDVVVEGKKEKEGNRHKWHKSHMWYSYWWLGEWVACPIWGLNALETSLSETHQHCSCCRAFAATLIGYQQKLDCSQQEPSLCEHTVTPLRSSRFRRQWPAYCCVVLSLERSLYVTWSPVSLEYRRLSCT